MYACMYECIYWQERLHARALQIGDELSPHINWNRGPTTHTQFLKFSLLRNQT